ncbi:MAG: hypothetical protein K6A23_04295 [Butyrivibrio sp.]|nr:hypothetical protein [Butyrivibrio sp.]
MEYIDLGGKWNVELEDGTGGKMLLPGTLDESGIGHADSYTGKLYQDENYVENGSLSKAEKIATRFTRKVTYEGEAYLSKVFMGEIPKGKRIFLEAERARVLRLFIDEKEVEALRGSLSTPYCFEVTGLLKKGSVIRIISDNSYKELPHDNIVYSSAATDETQTNWNGITGYFRLRIEDETFIEKVNVYPCKSLSAGMVSVYINSSKKINGKIKLIITNIEKLKCSNNNAFDYDVQNAYEYCILEKNTAVTPGITEIQFDDISFGNLSKWDEYQGDLYCLKTVLEDENREISSYDTTFGARSFGDDGRGHLSLNGRRVFLRSEANCCVHPETGYAPTDVESWINIIKTYMGYGINSLRFHSHCPPEAAFIAADELGIMLQPELSHWNPVDAFESRQAREYYEKELREILYNYGSHPSFVMLTFGNELQAHEEGLWFMHYLLDVCREIDDTRLYAISSNAFYGEKGCDEKSDFYTSMMFKDKHLRATFDGMRGYLNNDYPNAKHCFDDSVKELRKEYQKPVFSFEVGQYEVLPDFDEIENFKGISIPDNFKLIREKVSAMGLSDSWKKRVEATGELSLLCYREEVEAALRTKDFSGISLLGLQDFPGQGTALVGMLNSHLESKPFSFAEPERFRNFFRPVLPLVYLDKYTYTNKERLQAVVKLANYSAQSIKGSFKYRLVPKTGKNLSTNNILDNSEASEIDLPKPVDNSFYKSSEIEITCQIGTITEIGNVDIDLRFVRENSRFDLEVFFGVEKNVYPVWVYTEEKTTVNKPDSIYETKVMDERAIGILKQGGKVYLSPDSTEEMLREAVKGLLFKVQNNPESHNNPENHKEPELCQIQDSIKSTFTTDFWSVGTFASQEGSMGLMIEDEHPLFKDFPTEFHTDYQWWPMAGQRAFILPQEVESIVTVLDSYAYMRNMGMLMEFKCLKGKLFVSSLGLQNLQQYPECRALLVSIYSYMESEDFNPSGEAVIAAQEQEKYDFLSLCSKSHANRPFEGD